jgi:5-(carboxyamino)imidazole ribonucleotide synthase
MSSVTPGAPPTRPAPSSPPPPLQAGAATLGVLGGGQLGRMFVHAAQTLGFKVVVLEPDPNSPAAAAADRHLQHAYDQPQALHTLGQLCAAVTTEFENVPAQALEQLATQCTVSPAAAAVRICQHRAEEKRSFTAAGVPCAPYRVIADEADLTSAAAPGSFPGWPAILKTAQLGYDGKGQQPVPDAAALAGAWATLGRVPCVLEQRLPLQHEFSVVMARGADGAWVHLPVQQNLHRQGVLAVTQVPAPDVPADVAGRAVQEAARLAAGLNYVGVLCVEFFVLQDGTLVANEMAPRPHNSGHYSVDACDLSQFDLQVRTLAGLPLPMPRQHSAAVMLNLLGDLWFAATPAGGAAPLAVEPDWPAVLALPGAHLHLYGKTEARVARKMGHLTITGNTPDAAHATALKAAAILGIEPF